MTRDKRRNKSVRPSPPDPQSVVPAPPQVRPALVAAICAALVIVTLAAFWKVHSSGFVMLDDDEYVTTNVHVQQGLSGDSVAWAFTSTEAANWHPVTWLSHMLDVQLFGMDAGRHHLTSLLLHAINAVLLFLLLFRMTGALWRSAFVAALFALHPLHVESVAWIAERKDVLSTLFWLLTTGAWLYYVKSKQAAPYVLMLAFFALGLMAKPMLVTLPFTLLLLDYWPLQRLTLPIHGRLAELRKLLWEKAPLFAMTAASCVITVIAQKGSGAVQTLSQLSLGGRMETALRAYGAYLGKMILPSSLAVYYPHPQSGFSVESMAAAFLVIAGGTFLAFRMWKKAPYLSFGWLWYVGTLVPVIGLVQVGEQTMADRYTYIPLIGIFIAITWGIADYVKGNGALRQGASVAAAVVLAALFGGTRVQTGYWADSEALLGHALEVTSDNWLAHNNIGLVMYREGRTQDAIAHYTEALRIDPNYSDAHNNLGNALSAVGRVNEAIPHYNEALRVQPDAPNLLTNLGWALLRANRLSEAIPCFERALKINPGFADAHLCLGSAMDTAGRMPEALEQYQQVLRINPDSAQALNAMGMIYGKMNRFSESIERLEQAVKIAPDFSDARVNLGVSLDHAGRTSEALEQFQTALRIQPDSTRALGNLLAAMEKLNKLSEGIERFQQAVRENPNSAADRFHLGIALTHAHRIEEAREHLQKALQINPDFEPARAALESMAAKGGR